MDALGAVFCSAYSNRRRVGQRWGTSIWFGRAHDELRRATYWCSAPLRSLRTSTPLQPTTRPPGPWRRPGNGQRGARAKLAAVAALEAVSVPVDTSPTVVKFPALAVLLMVSVLPVIPVAELSRPTLAAPEMLSELRDTAPVDDSVAPATVPVAVSAAQDMAPEASTPVANTSVQFTSLHSSWSQPTLPCAVSHGDQLSLEGAGPDLQAVQVQRARRLLHQPGDRASEGSEAQLCDSARRTEKSRRAVLQTPCEGVPRKVPVTLSAALTYITKLEGVPSLYRQPKE